MPFSKLFLGRGEKLARGAVGRVDVNRKAASEVFIRQQRLGEVLAKAVDIAAAERNFRVVAEKFNALAGHKLRLGEFDKLLANDVALGFKSLDAEVERNIFSDERVVIGHLSSPSYRVMRNESFIPWKEL